MAIFDTVYDLRGDSQLLCRRAYGVICIEDEQFKQIELRPWPKIISLPEINWRGNRFHSRVEGNRCWLYYNQPRRHRNFLTLKYVLSSRGATLRTFRGSLLVLDEIARIKQSDAIVCEARNLRISDRLFQRWGWEPHVPSSRRRHFIKRFYGTYPPAKTVESLLPKD